MKLDDLRCLDCALMRSSHDVDCINHTPNHLRGAREMRIREVLSAAARRLSLSWGDR